MFLEGRIIEFVDGEQLRPGYVRKQERDRLQVIDPRGRHVSVNGDRVAVVHAHCTEDGYPGQVRAILERVQERQAEVDAELLWQSLGGSSREFLSSELADLFFSETTPEASSAVFHALSEDTLFFKRNGLRFVARGADQVSNEQTRRQRQKEREEAREKLTEAVRRLLRGRDPITPDLDAVVDRIQQWMRLKSGDETGSILEQIAGSGRARDAAYEILVRAGRIAASHDRFLAIAGIEATFPAAAVEAAAILRAATHDNGRLDYREWPALTIDDDETLEVDDALTFRRENGACVVGIHIADVSGFVPPGSPLDAEALKRAATIYLPTTAVRMLPEGLSTDLASLRAGAERAAFTVEVRFDENLARIGHRVTLSSIRIERRLNYDQADALIREGDPALSAMHRIALGLQKERAARGAIAFRRPELKIRVYRNEDGEDIRISKLDSNAPSRILVSEMMVLLNGLAADFAAVHALPVIFRTQEAREILPAEEVPIAEALAFERLRKTFRRSRLSLTPGLHSGLGLSAYTQVSSPIRRYSDLVTQRQFTALLQEKPIPHTREELLQVLATAEAAELEIRSLEERSNTYWLLQFLAREKMGEPLQAVLLDAKGTVELEDYCLRGKLSAPGDEPAGSVVQVTIDRIDPARGDIRFKRA